MGQSRGREPGARGPQEGTAEVKNKKGSWVPSGASADESRRPLGLPRRGLWISQEPPGAPAAPEAALRAPGLALRRLGSGAGTTPVSQMRRPGRDSNLGLPSPPARGRRGPPGAGPRPPHPKGGKERHDGSRPQSRLRKNSQVCGDQKQAADADGEEGSPAHPRATFRPAWGAESRGHSHDCLARVPATARRVVIFAARPGPHG